MSDLIGPRALGVPGNDGSPANEGAVLKDKADKEIDRILDEQYKRGMKILTENRDVLDMLAKLLIEKEKISGVEMLQEIKKLKPELIKEDAIQKVLAQSNPKDRVINDGAVIEAELVK
jgi:cell division protease FtsH